MSTPRTVTATHKQVWTAQGWKSVSLTEQDKRSLTSVRARLGYQQSDPWEKSSTSEMDMLQEIANQVQIDSPGLFIDTLPQSVRQIVEAPEEWYYVNGQLFKAIDPITQVKERGEWGSDSSDSDCSVLAERDSITRILLEKLGVALPDCDSSEIVDMMSSMVESDGNILDVSGSRIDVDVDSLSGAFTDVGSDSFVDCDDSDYCASDSYSNHGSALECLPNINDSVKARVAEIHKEYSERIALAVDSTEREILSLAAEQAIDSLVSPYVTYTINSPWCGAGYTPPRKRHTRIMVEETKEVTHAAEDRKEFFWQTFSEVSACSTRFDLYGNKQGGGVYEKLRGMWNHDRDLCAEWSIEDYDGKPSALTTAKREFVREYRTNKKGDEETLRATVWHLFDRRASEKKAVYFNGKLVEKSKKVKDCVWLQRRTEALKELFMTKGQWKAIYKMLDIAKKRFVISEEDASRTDTLSLLGKAFNRISTLSDINTFYRWAQKRQINPSAGTVEPCLFDLISIKDEHLIRQKVAKLKKMLTNDLVMMHDFNRRIKSVEETNLPEVSVICPDPHCDCMGVASPKFAAINDNHGTLFVECSVCGRKVIVKDSETITLKTKEELTNGR